MNNAVRFGFLLILLAVNPCLADDNYNFYFQKGRAPQNVIQGKESRVENSGETRRTDKVDEGIDKPEVASVDDSTQSISVATTLNTADSPHTLKQNRYHANFGYSLISDSVGTGHGYVVGFLYRWNPYLAVRTDISYITPESDRPSSTIEQKILDELRWNGMAAIDLTPLKINLVGHNFIELGVQVGVQSGRKLETDNEAKKFTAHRTGSVLAGFIARVAINDNFALEGYARRNPNGSMVASGAQLAFRF